MTEIETLMNLYADVVRAVGHKTFRQLVDQVRRDTWAAATKAQMESDDEALQEEMTLRLAPFPEVK